MDALKISYIGGPTALIEFGGIRFLTDPTFDAPGSEYVNGPVTLYKTIGPLRSVGELGPVNAVLLSHDQHLDNLDHAGRAMLPRAGMVITTVDSASRLVENAIGLAPGQEYVITAAEGQRVRVTATPAQHGPAGQDGGPVIGFVLEALGPSNSEGSVYISGDTVWFDGVAETLRRFPHIRTAILFMGAARVSMVPSHLTFTAEEGVRVARELPHATIVPLHYEGWKHFSESRDVIAAASAKAGLEHRLNWLH